MRDINERLQPNIPANFVEICEILAKNPNAVVIHDPNVLATVNAFFDEIACCPVNGFDDTRNFALFTDSFICDIGNEMQAIIQRRGTNEDLEELYDELHEQFSYLYKNDPNKADQLINAFFNLSLYFANACEIVDAQHMYADYDAKQSLRQRNMNQFKFRKLLFPGLCASGAAAALGLTFAIFMTPIENNNSIFSPNSLRQNPGSVLHLNETPSHLKGYSQPDYIMNEGNDNQKKFFRKYWISSSISQ